MKLKHQRLSKPRETLWQPRQDESNPLKDPWKPLQIQLNPRQESHKRMELYHGPSVTPGGPFPEPNYCSKDMPYLAVAVVSISSHEVDAVAVLIPEGSLIGQGTVGDSDVVVVVVGGEGTAVVVGHRVACKDTAEMFSYISVAKKSRFGHTRTAILDDSGNLRLRPMPTPRHVLLSAISAPGH